MKALSETSEADHAPRIQPKNLVKKTDSGVSLHALDRENGRLEGIELKVGIAPVNGLGLMGNQFHSDFLRHTRVGKP